jgi:hypothetical protein
MSPPITTYSGLLAAVDALGPPPSGTVRVFRGQTHDYPAITPSGLRKVLRRRAIWQAYTRHLHADLVRDVSNITVEVIQAIWVWLNAICQHYGPGSDFLDVTYSVEMALWFALHDPKETKEQNAIGPPGRPNSETDHSTEVDVLTFQPWNDPGCVYVFDLPKWDGKDLPKPGLVVDLADAPEIFSSSRRIRAQSACLIYCRTKESGPFDLRQHLKTTLIVARPMSGTPGLDRPVAQVFPSPEEDSWYAKLLSVPMIYAPVPTPPKLRRSIPVTVYSDETNPRYTQDVRWRDVALSLPLLHRGFGNFQRPASSSQSKQEAAPIPIVLEAPLVFAYASGDSELWHHALVSNSVPDRCPTYDFGRPAPSGEVSLSDVLFEFSFLENTGWDRTVKEATPIRLLRGVWLRRQDDGFTVAFVYQDVPGSEPEVVGFLSLRLDVTLRRLVWFHPENKHAPLPITEEPQMAKAVLLALMLLRELSADLHIEPMPRLQSGKPTDPDGAKFLLVTNRASARLYRVSAPAPWADWFVLRATAEPDEPFTQAKDVAGTFQVTAKQPFRDIPIDVLAKSWREQSV